MKIPRKKLNIIWEKSCDLGTQGFRSLFTFIGKIFLLGINFRPDRRRVHRSHGTKTTENYPKTVLVPSVWVEFSLAQGLRFCDFRLHSHHFPGIYQLIKSNVIPKKFSMGQWNLQQFATSKEVKNKNETKNKQTALKMMKCRKFSI